MVPTFGLQDADSSRHHLIALPTSALLSLCSTSASHFKLSSAFALHIALIPRPQPPQTRPILRRAFYHLPRQLLPRSDCGNIYLVNKRP
jgi:hypothetical protein